MTKDDDNQVSRALGRVEFDQAAGFDVGDAAQLITGMQHRQQSALAIYRAYRDAGTLSRYRRVSFRCAVAGCLLLDVFITPAGPAAYFPMQKLSAEANGATDRDARQARTLDGERRWIERADLLLSPPLEYWLNCDHVRNHVVPAGKVIDLVDTPPAKPVLV